MNDDPHHQESGDHRGRDLRVVIAGIGIGAALMYFLDPRQGRRRRALLGDRVTHAARIMDRVPRVVAHDLLHRACGLLAESKRRLRDGSASDEEIIARVRAKLGRVVSHPHAVDSSIRDGHVVLSGPILASEVEPLLRSLRLVPGVHDVENRLTAHEESGNISALQGGVPRHGERFELFQDKWAPATRVVAGTAGAGLLAGGLRASGALGLLSALIGGALVLRAATNRDMRCLLGLGEDVRGFEVQKTIHVAAPVERVFAFWADFRNFPKFMSRVLEVEILDDSRSQWVVAGPAGWPVQWTAAVTRLVDNELVEWRTEPGSAVQHSGTVRFDANGGGGTRVHVQLEYQPPAGVFGHAVASFFAADPKSELDEDLMRMKSALETGRAPHDAAQRLSRRDGETDAEASAPRSILH
jgi:uncharacterized membrane protein